MKIFTHFLLMVCITYTSFAQNVGINTTTPNPNAALDVESTDKGIMVPRLTTVQRTALGATLGVTDESLLVYDNDESQFYFWDGTDWSTDADRDPANEIQDISIDGTELSISDGSTIDLAPITGSSSTTTNSTPLAGSSGVRMVKLMEPAAQNDILGMAYIGADDNIWTHGYGLQYVWGVPGRTTNALKPVVQPVNPVNGEKIGKWKYVFSTRTTLWALTDEGEVFRRGYAYNGQLGNGSTSAHLLYLTKMTFFELNNLKVKYLCLPPAATISSTGSYNGGSIFAITEDGDVYCWGRNNYGQLGIGNTVQQTTPVKITGLDFQFIHKMTQSGSTGNVSVAALDTLNSVYNWGLNNYGQLGLGNTTNQVAPAQPIGIQATDILSTRLTYCAMRIITPSGGVMGAGYNGGGVLGDGTTVNKNVFTPTITPFTNASSIYQDLSGAVGAILTDDGDLYVAGDNPEYGLGLGTTAGKYTDYTMPAGPFQGMVAKVHIGGWGSYKSLYVLDSLGRIWTCGENRAGQLGQGTTHNADPDGLFTRAMDELSGAVRFVDIRAFGHNQYDYFSSVVLTEDGRVMITGAPQYGKTGQGDNSYFRRYYELINFN